MSAFALPDWESNAIGDEKCREIFESGPTNKKRLKQLSKKLKLKEKKNNEKKLQPTIKMNKHNNNKKFVTRNPAMVRASVKQLHNANSEETLQHDKIKVGSKQFNVGGTKQKIENKVKLQSTKRRLKRFGNADVDKIQESQENIQNLKEKIKQKVIKQVPINNYLNDNNDLGFEREPTNNIQHSPKVQQFLKIKANTAVSVVKKVKPKDLSLRQRMMEKLKASRFRYLNENIYTSTSKEAQKYFENDPDSFKAYHEGYKQQVARWPVNPLDVIIKTIKNLPENYVIADFGCGDARLAQSVKCKVYSFDLIATTEFVTACDMANIPLKNDEVDVAVFCLSLMGTNLRDYILEANRVLKMGGTLKIAEVESRFDSVESFIEGVQHFGFVKVWKDLSNNLFYFLEFKKVGNCKQKHKLPTLSLKPCLYKKR